MVQFKEFKTKQDAIEYGKKSRGWYTLIPWRKAGMWIVRVSK